MLCELKMLVINETLWDEDHILKVHSSYDWDKPDAYIITDCVLETIREKFLDATDKQAILIVDLSKGEFPPWSQVLKIAKSFMLMRDAIVSGLECTIIYADTNEKKQWVDRVLMIYAPAKPVHVVGTKTGILDLIGDCRDRGVEATACNQ